MIETSPHFFNLEFAIATAQKIMEGLPEREIGSDLDQLKRKSYILLQHAAIEEYLEQISIYALCESKKSFDENAQVAEPLISACIFYGQRLPSLLCDPSNYFTTIHSFKTVCKQAIEMHCVALRGVHGIKIKHQNAILNPIGIRLQCFDQNLSLKLNSLGAERGGISHSFGIQQITPKIGLENSTAILLRLLQSFDNEVCRKMRITFPNLGNMTVTA